MGVRLVGGSLAISALVLAHRSGFVFDILSIFDIIYLTRQPVREVKAPRLANNV